MNDLYKKIEELCSNKGVNITTMCKNAGISRAPLSDLKMGRNKKLSTDTLKKIAMYFNVSVDYLMGLENDNLSTYDNIFPIQKKKFPMLGEIACGEPIFADENKESYIEAGTDIHADFCLKAKGDSMINARILDGDIVFIKKQSMVDNGEIAAVIIENEATLKRVYYYPDKNKLILNPENPQYEPLVYIGDELNEIRILGKAVAFQSIVR